MRLTAMLWIRVALSPRNFENLQHEWGIWIRN